MQQISAKRLEALNVVDIMPQGLRECVHEFGLPIVSVLVRNGVRSPAAIREIVRECWLGARQTGQSGGVLSALDSVLATQTVSSAALLRYLASNSMTITPLTPTVAMIEASMERVSGHTVRCTKAEKHRWRLEAALMACKDEMLTKHRAG